MVQASAAELYRPAIDAQAVLHIRLNGADAEEHAFRVLGGPASGNHVCPVGAPVQYPGSETVERGMLRVPQERVIHGQGHGGLARGKGRNLGQGLPGHDGLAAVLADEIEEDLGHMVLGVFIPDFRLDLDICGPGSIVRVILDGAGMPGEPAEGQVQPGRVHKLHAAEKARAGIPAGIGLHAGIGGDDNAAGFPGIDKAGDVHFKGGIAVVLQGRLIPVHLYGGVHHGAVKAQANPVLCPFGGDRDFLHIVRHTGIVIAAGSAGGGFGKDVAFHHVIVGKVYHAVIRLTAHLLEEIQIAQAEQPALVKIHVPHMLVHSFPVQK